jgi:hypothetical protein
LRNLKKKIQMKKKFSSQDEGKIAGFSLLFAGSAGGVDGGNFQQDRIVAKVLLYE